MGLSVGSAPWGSERLVRGADYEFCEGRPGSRLAVFCGGVERPRGNFALFKRTQNDDYHRLYVNDTNHNYYQDKIDLFVDLIDKTVSALKVNETVYWGNSAGAYLALVLGLRDPRTRLIYAFTPQFRLSHPDTFGWRHAPTPDSRYADILVLVQSTRVKTFMMLPLYEPDDGITIQECLTIQNHDVTCFYLKFQHSTEFFLNCHGDLDLLIESFFRLEAPTIPSSHIGSELDVDLAVKSYHIGQKLRNGSIPDLPVIADGASQNPAWWQMKARTYLAARDADSAILFALKSLKCQPSYEPALIDLGDAFRLQELWFLASSAFQQALRVSANESHKWLRLAEVQIRDWKLDEAFESLGEAKARPHDTMRLNDLQSQFDDARRKQNAPG